MEKEGKYIYCITDNGIGQTFGAQGIGSRGDEVYTICFQDIGAVVSNSPIRKYPVLSENYVAHEKVIEKVMKSHTVLPVRFCTIAEDGVKVKNILEKEYGKLKNLLQVMKGKKELGLKAVFKEIIFDDIPAAYEDIKTFKEKIAAKSQQATYYLRMELGKMVEEALKREKGIYKEKILTTLEPLAEKTVLNRTIGERMILNGAFLVSDSLEEEFDKKVNELGNSYNGKVNFKYVGNVPPFNFINLTINIGEY